MKIILAVFSSLAIVTVSEGLLAAETEQPRNRSIVRVTTIRSAPSLTLKPNPGPEDIGNELFQGFIPDLLKEIFSELNLDYVIELVRDGQYGTRDPKSDRWSGMIGQLVRGESDIAAAPLRVTAKREIVVNYTVPWRELSLALLLRRDAPINSLNDLISQFNYTYGVVAEGSAEDAVIRRPDEPFQTMWSRIANQYDDVTVATTEEGVNKTKQENYVFILEKPTAEYFANMDCDLKTVDSFLSSKGYSFAVSKLSQVIDDDIISQRMTALKESGKLDELYDKWWTMGMCVNSATALLPGVMFSLTLLAALIFM